MNTKPQFSILVPVYNAEKYLRECIDSVLKQSCADFELILVDDGSTDGSGRICDAYAEQDKRVTVIHKENGGQLSARIAALRIAAGEYCLFLDSDDYLEYDALQILNEKIKVFSYDCIYFGYVRVDENSNFLKYYEDIPKEALYEDPKEFCKAIFCNESFNSMCRKAVKRSLIPVVDYSDFYRIKLGEDLLQTVGILQNTKNVLFITDHLYNYRMNPTSITHSVTFDNYRIDNTVRAKVLDFLYANNIFEDNDFCQYRTFCVNLLVMEIIRIGMFDTNNSNKKKLYDEIRNDSYYASFVLKGEINKSSLGKRAVLFDLFKKHRDGTILLLCSLNRMRVSAKQWVSKFVLHK